MTLLKELSSLNEGAVDNLLSDLIEKYALGVRKSLGSAFTYSEYVEALTDKIRIDKSAKVFEPEGVKTSAISKFIRGYLPKEELISKGWLSESITRFTPWDIINNIAAKDFGDGGFPSMATDEANTIIKIASANTKARQLCGNDFMDCSVKDMRKIINAHPELLKGVAAQQFKKQLTEDEEIVQDDMPDQRLIRTAGGFNLVSSVDGQQISLYDDAGKLLVQMPVVIWKQLQGSI